MSIDNSSCRMYITNNIYNFEDVQMDVKPKKSNHRKRKRRTIKIKEATEDEKHDIEFENSNYEEIKHFVSSKIRTNSDKFNLNARNSTFRIPENQNDIYEVRKYKVEEAKLRSERDSEIIEFSPQKLRPVQNLAISKASISRCSQIDLKRMRKELHKRL